MFSLEHVAAKLRIPSAGQALCTDWDSVMQISPSQALPFLESTFITQAAQAVDLSGYGFLLTGHSTKKRRGKPNGKN